MEVKAAKVTGKLLLNLLKKLMKEAEKLGGLEKLVNAIKLQQEPDYEFEKVHPAVLFLHAHYVESVDLLSKLDVAYQDILALDENDIQFID